MSTREAGLQEVLNGHFASQMKNVYTAIPGIVVTVRDNLNNMYVDVQPTVNFKWPGETDSFERPPILNVPIQMPVSKTGGITFPIVVGDPVLLVFTMRGLDVWKRGNGYPTTPVDDRVFDKRDCVAIPGVFPISEAVNNPSKRTESHSTKDTVVVNNIGKSTEIEIRFMEDGNVKINCAPGQLVHIIGDTQIDGDTVINGEVTINGNTTMNGNHQVNGNFGVSGLSEVRGKTNLIGGALIEGIEFRTHVHSGIQPGNSNTNIPVG